METKKIRVSDYLAQRAVTHGIQHTFMVTGGGAMHLNDALGRAKGMEVICCHHEQACAMAAESYGRMSGKVALLNVTTGPGGTNALTGVYGAYVDSIGMVILSGQVKTETLVTSYDLPLRQLGDQEINIVAMAKPITKYAQLVTEAKTIRYHFEKALFLASEGRPGPTWLDIPINVQGSLIDPDSLPGFDPRAEGYSPEGPTLEPSQIEAVLARLRQAKRPVILAGAGVRLSHSHELFLRAIDKLQIPVTTGWNAHDVIWNDHPLYVGRPGSVGDRAGNFAVQNSDFLLVLGSRLNIRQISYAWHHFARHAYKVMVDVDRAELEKPTLKIDLPIHADLNFFLRHLLEMEYTPQPVHREYRDWCRERTDKYKVVLPQYWKSSNVNPYCFVESLFTHLPENQWVVTGDGTACVVTFQAAALKKGQRLFTNSGCASMGYDLPAAVGASISGGKQPLVCIAGDGSLQMNLQELQTVRHHRLPIKLFVLNNRGYHSIRQTQHNYFPDNIVGCGTESGLSFPEMQKLAVAYDYPYVKIENHAQLADRLPAFLHAPGHGICEVILDLEQQFAPKVSSKRLPDGSMVSSPLEDMAPFLPREELQQNMLVPLPDGY